MNLDENSASTTSQLASPSGTDAPPLAAPDVLAPALTQASILTSSLATAAFSTTASSDTGSAAAPAPTTPATSTVPADSTAAGVDLMAATSAATSLTSDRTASGLALEDWNADWRTAAASMPCSSCSGRNCTVCSIRIGGPSGISGMPSGYSPRVVQYYDPEKASSTLAPALQTAGLAPATPSIDSANTSLDSSLSTVQAQAAALFAASSATGTETGISTGTGSPSSLTSNAASEPQAALSGLNKIVLENMKQGTPESVWWIDEGDDTIEGFATDFTINHGQTESFKINTDSTHYRIDIYRLGYYGGDGARLVDSINVNLASAQVQPDPLFDPTTKLVDAGNWSVSASWNIPSDAVSGVYIAELVRLDGDQGKNIIPFVVRDDEAPADITFQTSDETWEAYNWWGGYNFYGGIDEGGRGGRAEAVSYNRPFITRDAGFQSGPQDFLFGEEYPAIRWLEENGYDVNYISGIDTASNPNILNGTQVFLSVGHDEYWSADQRATVEAARDDGVNLAFMSGNEVYWETRWEPSIDGSGTPYKTLVSYKERWDNADTDPGNTTSTWRDPVLGAGEPENGLTGTIFTVDAYRLDTIQIPYDLSNFRFWSNTAVANIQPGQVYSLTPNLLGYEWDSDLDNGSRPAGLIDLSSTTVDVNTLLYDYGNTTGPGTATHSLTLYRAPSGALVFGAGTVYWSWGLDDHHDNEETPTDPNVQQAMVNLFADMGVQPQTLMQSLIVAEETTDHTAPTSVITSPNPTGSYTAGQEITITGTATDTGGGIIAVVEVSTDGGQTWHRATGFENWSYTWTPVSGGTYKLMSRAVDDSVNLETPSAGETITVAQGNTVSLFANVTPQTPSENDVNFVNLGVAFKSSEAGTIIGFRYYKGIGDSGVSHEGALWSANGTLLAEATFVNESQSGWQTVILDHPVSIAAGATFIVGYHSNGGYASTPNYFNTPHTVGPLTATGGYYDYDADLQFPSNPLNSNYFVDVIFSPVVGADDPPNGVNDDGFITPKNTAITIAPAVLLANDTDPNGDPLTITGAGAATNGSVSFNALTGEITFTPTANYVGPASFGYSMSDGRGGTGSALVHLYVGGASLFSGADTPTTPEDGDAFPINLGVSFSSSKTGTIVGIKYYKSAADNGTHTGSLWSSTGQLLATATFVNETASGWQTVLFSNPVSITAGQTYVASFHSGGHYAATPGYFSGPYTSGPLTIPSGNGLYTYADDNEMPTNTYQGANYWVDVIFSATPGANTAPIANDDGGFATQQDAALQLTTASLLANDTDADGDPLTVVSVGGANHGTVSLSFQVVTFTPDAGYVGAASFTYTISDGSGGTATANVAINVTSTADRPPVANDDSGLATQQNVQLIIPWAVLLGNDSDPDNDPLTIVGVSGASHGTVVLNTDQTITFTPEADYLGPASFTYTISDGRTGSASANVSLGVTAAPTGTGLFAPGATPAVISVNDNNPVELGMKFTVSASGTINGIRFYKAPDNTGTHTGSLWTSDGTLLGNLTFTNETATGWQTATFSTPIAVTAGQSYVVGYHTDGHYSADANYFASSVSNGTLTAPAGDNGVFAYGAGTSLPTSSYNSTNYWVDVLYQRGTNQPPVANDDSGLATQKNTALAIPASTLLANDNDPDNDPLTITAVSGASNGTVSLNGQVVTFTPTTDFTGNAGFSYTISDGTSTASANVSLAVTPQAAGVSLFATGSAPTTVTVNDAYAVELGMKFTPLQDGTITGIRFYKGPQNTGPHTGTLWTATGTQLGNVTFSNETATGWQTAAFATPISVTTGQTYVVGYHTNGFYSADSGFFTSDVSNGQLTAPAGNNGVYLYGGSGAFPTESYNSSNYWVDVVFNAQIAA